MGRLPGSKITRFIVKTVIVVACLLVIGKLFLIVTYRSSPGLTADAFYFALRNNDSIVARSVTSSEHTEFIADWMSQHEVGECSEGFTLDGPTGVGSFTSEQKWTESISDACFGENNYPYCFRIREIVVEKAILGWHVTSWGEIREDCEE
jgi:hypothetical protein